jgi:chromosomal replication initiator protein
MEQASTWSKALELIQRELNNEQAFQIWFGPVRFVSQGSGSIKLEVPNKYFRDWLVERYSALITNSVSKINGSELGVEFVVKEGGDEEILAPAQPQDGRERKEGFLKGVFFQKERPDAIRELGLNPRYTFESFVVGPSNRFAHAASLAVSDSPAKAYNPLFIYGGVGLGKTHLTHAIGQRIAQKFPRSKILYISSEDFTNQLIGAIQNRTTAKFRQTYRNVDTLLIDDIHFIAGKESTQEEFFHTFNTLYDAHKQIVVTSDRPPKEISALEARLVSRFEWGLVTDIQAPDFETRIAILKKKSERETVAVPDDVLYFLAEKIRSNIRELEGALIRVVAYAKLMGNEMTVGLVKEILKDMIKEGQKKVTIELIQKKVADYFNIGIADMKAKRRTRGVAYPRQIAMYLTRKLTDHSLPEIGEFFGGRDHTTVIHAHDKIEADLKKNDSVKDVVDRLVKEVLGN